MNAGGLNLNDLLERYADTDDPQGSDDDFDQVAQQAPRGVVSEGFAQAFKSDRTPPFPNMLGQMFGRSDPDTRAGILNQLISSLGPQMLSGGGGGALGGSLAGLLGGLLGGGTGGTPRVTPEQASRVPPEAVEQLAGRAQERDPTVIDRISDFAAEHPGLMKGLGAAAVGIALKHLAGQKRGGLF
jgi:hypothetical protein